MGVNYETFWHLNPKKMNPFFEANRIKQENRDQEIWTYCGNYFISAIMTAVDKCLNGKKSRIQYIDEPILSGTAKSKKEFTEQEIQRQRELFVAKLLVMKTNFELNHKNTKS